MPQAGVSAFRCAFAAFTSIRVRVRTAYRCRAYPDEAQQRVLARTFGCVRVVWNRTLAAQAKVARAHRKVRSARQDFLHRATARLVRENDVIVVEDLAVKNMIRNRHLARVISGSPGVRSAVKQELRPARPGIPVLQGGE